MDRCASTRKGLRHKSSLPNMGGDEHPFSGYNKRDIHNALVGNWVEERALEADTGIFRYQVRREPFAPLFRPSRPVSTKPAKSLHSRRDSPFPKTPPRAQKGILVWSPPCK